MTTNSKTPAMLLQEYTVRKKIAPPDYDLIYSNTGTHENEFHYRVNVAGVQAIGVGRSKQVAKHDSAYKAIELLRAKGVYDDKSPPPDFNPQLHRNEPENFSQAAVNHIGQLNDICCENKLPYATLNEISDVGPPHCRQFTWECELSSLKTQATANTKKQAKQIAAKLMLDRIRDILPELIASSEDARNALTDSDDVKDKYVELSFFNVIPNKSCKIEDFSSCFAKIIMDKKLSPDDFQELLNEVTEESLRNILDKLDLEFQYVTMQEEPTTIVALIISTDTPFTALGMGSSLDQAKSNALCDTFEFLKTYFQAEVHT